MCLENLASDFNTKFVFSTFDYTIKFYLSRLFDGGIIPVYIYRRGVNRNACLQVITSELCPSMKVS